MMTLQDGGQLLPVAETQPMAAKGDGSEMDRDPNDLFACYVNDLTLRDIPMNARFVGLLFRDCEQHVEEVISEEMFDKVVDIVAQRPAIRWLSCQSFNFKNLSVDRVRKLLKVNANLFVQATSSLRNYEPFADDTVHNIGKLSVDELRRVCFVCEDKLLEDEESVRKSLSPLQLSTMAEAWHTNRRLASEFIIDHGAWFRLSEKTREELLSHAFDEI